MQAVYPEPTLKLRPQPGSAAELEEFARLQARMKTIFKDVFPDRLAERTVVVVPSLSLDSEHLAKIPGVQHYEERMLCLLMLLRMPRTRLVYVTSQPLHPTTVDYFLHLLPGIPSHHARRRLTLLDCADSTLRPLTEKILERPRLLARIAAAINERETAHLTCFNVTHLERSLAVQLGIPIYGNDPELSHLGSKRGSRAIFEAAGVTVPDAATGIDDRASLVDALVDLHLRNPGLERVVVKLDEGFSGEGNAIFSFADGLEPDSVRSWVDESLENALTPIARGRSSARFIEKLSEGGALAEVYVEGADKRSPSVQCRIDPLGRAELLSTHEQILDPTGQIYQGCTFPADPAYRLDLQEAGERVGNELAARGGVGRFAVDFVSVREAGTWRHYALEINLRKGGTTLPQLMLQFLTDGWYDHSDGTFRSRFGAPLSYYASDNVESERYRGLSPDDVIDIAVCNGLHFDQSTQTGTVFHLLGAVSEFGKLGTLCIAPTPEAAVRQHEDIVHVLDEATR